MRSTKTRPVAPKILAALKRIVANAEHSRLRHLEYTVLDLVAPGNLSQVELHRELGQAGYKISIGQVSRVVSELDRLKLVARTQGHNARTKRLSLTKKGREEAVAYENQLSELAIHFLKKAAHPVVELHIGCPNCGRKLRISKHGPAVKNRCPSCSQRFFVRFEEETCIVEPCGIEKREHEDPINPYEELRIHRGATRDEIASAKRNLLKRYHPDIFHNLGPDFVALATKRSQRINAAFDRLVR